MPKAEVVEQEFDSTTTPETIAVDGDFPADSIVPDPVTEEYGIAPSAFGPRLLEGFQDEDHRQGWTDLPGSAGTGMNTLANAREGNSNQAGWTRLKLRSSVHSASACLQRLEMPRHLLNVRFQVRKARFCGTQPRGKSPSRAMVPRSFGRSSRAYRGYQPRSPPDRT